MEDGPSLLIKRRYLLKCLGALGLGAMFFLAGRLAYGVEVINRIRARLMKPVEIPPDHERTVTKLPPEGPDIPVEITLNSRCTSDYNDAPEMFHWGMFNKDEKLSPSQIQRIHGYINIPRLTEHRTEVRVNGNELTFLVDRAVSGFQRDMLLIESGMQQQAACLICAALGVGMVFKSFGKDGRDLSETDHATVRIKLDAMKPSYNGLYWTALPPNGIRPWLKGNLPAPDRTGKQPLIKTLSGLMPQNDGSKQVTESLVGQLLWAARGRTPHLYKSRAWGMTIPTSHGAQDNTKIYYWSEEELSTYINWSEKRPTHSLEMMNGIKPLWWEVYQDLISSKSRCIIITKNINSEKGCWEVGYQLLNILIQAKALDINYQLKALDKEKRYMGNEIPVVAICL